MRVRRRLAGGQVGLPLSFTTFFHNHVGAPLILWARIVRIRESNGQLYDK